MPEWEHIMGRIKCSVDNKNIARAAIIVIFKAEICIRFHFKGEVKIIRARWKENN